MFSTGAGVYRVVLGVLSSAISAVMYRIVGKGQRFVGPMEQVDGVAAIPIRPAVNTERRRSAVGAGLPGVVGTWPLLGRAASMSAVLASSCARSWSLSFMIVPSGIM